MEQSRGFHLIYCTGRSKQAVLWVLYYNAFYLFPPLPRFLSLWESRFSQQVCCHGITCIFGMPGQLWPLTLPAMSLSYLSLLLCTWWWWSSRWDCSDIYTNPLKTEYSAIYCILILSSMFCAYHLRKEYLLSWRVNFVISAISCQQINSSNFGFVLFPLWG